MNLLDVLFPKRCVGCGKIGKYFCDHCISDIRVIKPNEAICPVCERPAIDGATHPGCKTRYTLDGLTSFFRYEGVIRKAVKAIKYRYVSDLAKEFVDLILPDGFSVLPEPYTLSPASPAGRPKPCIFVPIPLHPSRQRDRGFNQAEVLARVISRHLPAGKAGLNIPIRTDILRRARKTKPQVEMKKREARLKNMDGVFTLHQGFDKTVPRHQNVKISERVILFDDVFTTGATMRTAANVLKRGGVTSVWGITMAR